MQLVFCRFYGRRREEVSSTKPGNSGAGTTAQALLSFQIVHEHKICAGFTLIYDSISTLNRRVTRLIRRHGGPFETITSDNGTEFHDYKGVEGRTGVAFYLATPHHSRERSSNENADGLIRQYLPKGQSMAGLSQPQCNAIARKLNARPRKRLGFRTPLECFNESWSVLHFKVDVRNPREY